MPPEERGRPGNRHADRLLRDGFSAANFRSRVHGPQKGIEGDAGPLRCRTRQAVVRACVLARARLIERGVRFVNIYHEGWDAHTDVVGNHKGNLAQTDRATAALLKDLKRRGLLDDTLVIWGGEFGRTPMIEQIPGLGRNQGRDHHPQAYTMWMAGGGVKAGLTYGATDDLGFHVAERPRPRPRPASNDPASARLRPREADFPPRWPGLPPDRRAWQGGQGDSCVTGRSPCLSAPGRFYNRMAVTTSQTPERNP